MSYIFMSYSVHSAMEFIKVYFIFFKGCSECYAVCSAVRLAYICVFLV